MDKAKSGSVDRRAPLGQGFLFIGKVLALDLVNTEIAVRGKRVDLLATPDDATAWWGAARREHRAESVVRSETKKPVDSAALLDALKSLRTSLCNIFRALAEGQRIEAADVAVLNRVLRMGYHSLDLAPRGDGILPVYRTSDRRLGTALLPIGLSAHRLLTSGQQGRLHKCKNDRCVLLFYDTTKSATRRWCSVGCMNRARSILRYRQKTLRAEPAATARRSKERKRPLPNKARR